MLGCTSTRPMKKLALIYLVIWATIWPCPSLTDLDYHLGKSKYGSATLTQEEGFHGSGSAMLSVEEGGSYIRVSVYFDQPLPIEDLDYLSMWLNPQSGDGQMQIEIFLDGDSDSSYDSKSSADRRLRTSKDSWSDRGMSPGQWNELDGFDLSYENYNTQELATLEEHKHDLQGLNVVKLYITIYKDPTVEYTKILIDYLKIGDQLISFEPLEKEEPKSGPGTASPGGVITYTLTYGNNQMEPADVVIIESYDPRTVFVSADPPPDPGTDNIWTIPDLQPGQHGQIQIKVRTSKFVCKSDIRGKTSGTGYAFVKNFLSNDLSSYEVTNHALFSYGHLNATAFVTTVIRPVAGSTFSLYQHGYGPYQSQGRLSYSASSISVQQELNASSARIEVNTLHHPVAFNGRLYAQNLFISPEREISLVENYRYADNLSLETRSRLSKSSSDWESISSFSGFGEIAQRWRDTAYMQQYAGSFSLAAQAHTRILRKTKSGTDGWLECCLDPEEK